MLGGLKEQRSKSKSKGFDGWLPTAKFLLGLCARPHRILNVASDIKRAHQVLHSPSKVVARDSTPKITGARYPDSSLGTLSLTCGRPQTGVVEKGRSGH